MNVRISHEFRHMVIDTTPCTGGDSAATHEKINQA